MISVHFQGKPFNITVIQVYAPTTNVYEDIQDVLELTPQKDVLFIRGDWNAKVGSQGIPGVTGKFGLRVQNEAEQRLTDFCQENTPVIPTTGRCFHFGSIFSFFLELFLNSSPVAYWAPTDLGSSSFSIISFCLFILFMGFSMQEVHASKFGKLSSGHRTGNGHFSLQSQRKAMPKNVQTTSKLHSCHMLAK